MEFRQLTVADLSSIQALQQVVVEDLEDKGILQPLSTEEFLNILNGNGIMIGVYEDEELVAFRALLKPATNEDEHLGLDVGALDLARVMYQEVSVVHPNMRGKGLQQQMGKFIMAKVDTASYDWVCATVMPFNIASMKDKLGQGLFIRALKLKYGGKLRYVFGKDLHEVGYAFSESQLIAMADTVGQQALLAQGYVGTSISYIEDEWFVQYER